MFIIIYTDNAHRSVLVTVCLCLSLAESLGEFGTHLPAASEDPPPLLLPTSQTTGATSGSPPAAAAAATLSTEEFDDIFSEEFGAQAEAQLNEAMEILASENPMMWEQLQQMAKGGFPGGGGAAGGRPLKTSGEATSSGGGEEGEGEATSLDDKLEETLKQLRESTEQIEVGWLLHVRTCRYHMSLCVHVHVHVHVFSCYILSFGGCPCHYSRSVRSNSFGWGRGGGDSRTL